MMAINEGMHIGQKATLELVLQVARGERWLKVWDHALDLQERDI